MLPLFYILSFTNGFLVLVLEISAGRIMAPVFGNTTLTWTAIITAVLLGLGLGYAFGGWCARRAKDLLRLTILLLVVSGLLSLLLPLFGNKLLFTCLESLPFQSAALLAAQGLFAPPLFLISTISPLLIELVAQRRQQQAGVVSGTLFALSTIGSLAGALVTAFLLLPYWPLSNIMRFAGLLLIISGLFLALQQRGKANSRQTLAAIVLVIASLGGFFLKNRNLPTGVLWQSQNLYQQHLVKEENGVRYLYLDRSVHGAVETAPRDGQPFLPRLHYTRLTEIIHSLITGTSRGYVVGGGAYLIPRLVREKNPAAAITVAEIDRQVEKLAHHYFGLTPSTGVRTIFQDGRVYLYKTAETWDWIWVDAFQDYTAIPAHLLSREFFTLAAQRLTENGIFLINTVMPRQNTDRNPLFQAVYATLSSSFRQVKALQILDNSHPLLANVVFVATQQPLTLPKLESYTVIDSEVDAPILTDDFNPSETLALSLYQ